VVEWVIVGTGNPDGGDDRVGHAVLNELQRLAPEQAEFVTLIGADPGTLMEAWAAADGAIIVDAMVSGAPAGTVHRFDVAADPLPAEVHVASTHSLGVDTAIEMARALGKLPAHILVYGIEGTDFGTGADISGEVAGAVPVAVEMIREEIASADGRRPGRAGYTSLM